MLKKASIWVLLSFLLALAACTSQRLFYNEIYLFNSCRQTLQIVVTNDTNMIPREREFIITPGSQEVIGLYLAPPGQNATKQILDSFNLRITASDGASVQVNANMLRTHLQQIDRIKQGKKQLWIIDDLAFCPTSGTSAP